MLVDTSTTLAISNHEADAGAFADILDRTSSLAFARCRKRRDHPARSNMGDCFTYSARPSILVTTEAQPVSGASRQGLADDQLVHAAHRQTDDVRLPSILVV